MRLLFAVIGLLGFSISATAASEWLYYKEYPWVYDHVSKDWLYLRGASGGEVYAYRSSTKEWEVFKVSEPTWEEQYEEWILDPEPYGGLSVLQEIKVKRESGETAFFLYSKISDLSPLAGLKNLTVLQIENDNNFTDLTPLAGLTNLDYLSLGTSNISDLTPLAGLTNLTRLYPGTNNITDLTPLAGLTNLTHFGLGTNITDLTPLAGWKNLEYLGLTDDNITDLTPLAGLTNLEYLYLDKNNITDLSPLAGLTNLTHLYLDKNNITDLTPLAGLTNLSFLYLHDNPITASQKAMLKEALPSTNITWPNVIIDDSQETEKTWEEKYEEWMQNPEPYGGLDALQKIKEAKDSGATELELNNKNIADLSPLAGLTNLTRLYLYSNNISDLSPFAGLTNLTRLYLGDNNFADLTPLAELSSLTSLYLEQNNISDLTPLAGLTNLKQLSLNGNNISDLAPLTGLTNLELLFLENINISESQKAILEEALPYTFITADNFTLIPF